jgi:hypothetical protein
MLLSEAAGFYGLPPSQAPLALHAAHHGSRPRQLVPGSRRRSDHRRPGRHRHRPGGQFPLGHEVTRIEVSGGAVTGVEARATDGATGKLGAAVVVSNSDIERSVAS